MASSLLVIACGAIARELVEVQKLNHWDHIDFQCLPAELHNTPDRIPGEVEALIHSMKEQYDDIFVAYADCGTGGLLDAVLNRHGIKRLPGAHSISRIFWFILSTDWSRRGLGSNGTLS
jgi:hypothetical protein